MGKLRSLPNVLYTDGNAFSLWQAGELVGAVVPLVGDIEASGKNLTAPPSLLALFESFLKWQPLPPRSARELAQTSARLCRLLRDEVTEQLALGSEAFTALATDWRKLLFPDATDERFADGYAQAVTFGLLMARAKGIPLTTDLQHVATELAKSNSLIGAALRLLTDNTENQATLKTSLGTLTRVLDAVNWKTIGKGNPDAWLYFYEDFLEIYDNDLRKLTGSYYTPPEGRWRHGPPRRRRSAHQAFWTPRWTRIARRHARRSCGWNWHLPARCATQDCRHRQGR